MVELIKEKNISIKIVISAIIVSIAAIVAAPAAANAISPLNFNQSSQLDFLTIGFDRAQVTPEPIIKVQESKPEPAAAPKPPEPEPDRKYTVQEGDNLSKIAEQNSTTWPRLWNKNLDLKDPNLIYKGQILIIPPESEVLKDRAVPAIQAQTAAPGVRSYNSAGNTYAPGNCTWYVKNRRPDLPGNLGNANTWQSMARADGLPTGSTPRAGAVGTTTAGDLGHVVYVERVNGDGTILISEMNYAGLYSQRSRTANAWEFQYIY
jgi:surface antigen